MARSALDLMRIPVLSALFLAVACDGGLTPTPTGGTDNVAEAVENAADATMEAGVDISWSRAGSGAQVTLKNTEATTLHVQRIVVNGQENDSNCRINIFRDLGANQQTIVAVPACGEINTIRVFTDRGEASGSWNSFERSVAVATDNTPGYRTTSIRNVGPGAWTVNRLVLNEQPNDPLCVIRVFQEVQPQGQIVVNTDTCGQVNQVQVDSPSGTALFNIPPPEPYDSAVNAAY